MADNIIEVKDLVYDYTRDSQDHSERITVRALDGVSFDVRRGEFLAVMGKNGSGKSTLAKCLNALYLPTSGEVRVNGWDTRDEEHLWEIRQSAGMVFQNPDNQLVSSIVEDDVAFGPENMGVPSNVIRKRVDAALEAVGMRYAARKAPHLLSGGQKQRVAIAGVIAMMPECIIMDEPTAMLDPKGREDILEIARDLNKEGITVILITHFMDEVARADRVVVMSEGKILKTGTPKEVFQDKELIEKEKLDKPAAFELAEKLRESGIDIPEGITLEQDLVDILAEKLQRD